jgi:hypothetical protein
VEFFGTKGAGQRLLTPAEEDAAGYSRKARNHLRGVTAKSKHAQNWIVGISSPGMQAMPRLDLQQ